MVSEYIAPLDLQYIFQNIFSGSPIIFTAMFIIGFSILAGVFKMKGEAYLMLIALASILLYGWFGGGLFTLVMFIGGLLIFWAISKVVKD